MSANVLVRLAKIRLEFHGLPEPDLGFVITAHGIQKVSLVGVDDCGERVELPRQLNFGERLVAARGEKQAVCEPAVGPWHSWG